VLLITHSIYDVRNLLGLHFNVVNQRNCRPFLPVSLHTLPLLGAFAKLRKTTISFVRPSTWTQLGSHLTDFHEISYMNIFLNSVGKIQVPLRSDENHDCFTRRQKYIFDHMSFRFQIKQMVYYVKNTTRVQNYWYFIIATCFGHKSYYVHSHSITIFAMSNEGDAPSPMIVTLL